MSSYQHKSGAEKRKEQQERIVATYIKQLSLDFFIKKTKIDDKQTSSSSSVASLPSTIPNVINASDSNEDLLMIQQKLFFILIRIIRM